MKFSFVSVGLLALLSPLTAAWSKEDREIFRIRDEISAHATDAAATFYDILGLPPSASQDDITKAYRAQSRSLHPDKVKQKLKSDHKKREKAAEAAAAAGNGGTKPKAPTSSEIRAAVKAAEEAQTRLSLIANILKGPERDRYDHFLRNGFPLWKGTDYYYNRYRPGLGTAIVGVLAFCGGAVHYLILYMNWKRHTEFIDRYIRFARDTAWGGSLNVPEVDAAPPAPAAEEPEDENNSNNAPPQPMNRKERRFQEKQARKEDGRPASKKAARKAPAQSSSSSRSASATPTGVRKRVVAENGKILVVDSAGDVYLEEEDEEGNVGEYLLDPNELAKPTVMDTAVVRVPLWAFHSTIGRFLPQPAVPVIEVTAAAAAADGDAQDESESASPSQQNTPATDSAGEDFEMISKSTDSLGRAKTSGAQQGGKANKRKGRKK